MGESKTIADRQLERARHLTDLIIEELNLQKIDSEALIEPDDGTYWISNDSDILLVAASETNLGKVTTTFSLISTLFLLLEEFDKLLSDSDVKKYIVA